MCSKNLEWMRTATVTANGIILGFTFTFFTGWSGGPDRWQWHHLPSLVFFLVGIGMLVRSLFLSLDQNSYANESAFGRTRTWMVGGTAVFAGGILVSILLAYLVTYCPDIAKAFGANP